MRNQNEIVYCIDGEKIEKYTWAEFCIAYGSDTTTTPNGVAPRCFIWEDTGEGLSPIELRNWGFGGSGPSTLIDTYNTIEDAQNALLGIFEDNTLKSDQTPPFYNTIEDAQNALLEQ